MIRLFASPEIPNAVKRVAIGFLLMSLLNLLYAVAFLSSFLILAPLAFLKALFSIYIAYKLLCLEGNFRTLTLILAVLALFGLPIYSVLVLASPDIFNFIALISGTESLLVMETIFVVGFVFFLWVYRVLTRPDIEMAFGGQQANPSAA